jgi:hypothetical protein
MDRIVHKKTKGRSLLNETAINLTNNLVFEIINFIFFRLFLY